MAAEERLLVPIEVFSDTLCPWCWVEKRSIEAAMRRYQAKHPDVDFELVWRSFCLNPLLKTSESSLPPPLPLHAAPCSPNFFPWGGCDGGYWI